MYDAVEYKKGHTELKCNNLRFVFYIQGGIQQTKKFNKFKFILHFKYLNLASCTVAIASKHSQHQSQNMFPIFRL